MRATLPWGEVGENHGFLVFFWCVLWCFSVLDGGFDWILTSQRFFLGREENILLSSFFV